MTTATLNIPVLVQTTTEQNQFNYIIRPLFFNHPQVRNSRLNIAQDQFKKELKSRLAHSEFSRNTGEVLLWYMFNPEWEYNRIEVDYNISKHYIKGVFGYVYFSLKDIHFVAFPSLKNYMLVVHDIDNVQQEIEKTIKDLLKQYISEEEAFDASHYYSNPTEFTKLIEFSVPVKRSKFNFEVEESWFFSQFSQAESFDGEYEAEKVGYNLNSLYPNLSRAHLVDERVKQLYQIIFQKENTPIVLVGKKGIGRHTLLHEVVYLYQSNYYGKNNLQFDKQLIWHLNPNRIIAGMSIVGQWQRRFEAILDYLHQPYTNTNPNNEKENKKKQALSHKLLIDNPVAMTQIGKSSQNDMNLNSVLRPYLEKRQLQVIFIATPQEWKILQEKDRRFCDLFPSDSLARA